MTRLPASITAGVERWLQRSTGRAIRIAHVERVGGGCISPAARVRSDAGDVFFLKWNDGSSPVGMFEEEARSLRALGDTRTVRVPSVLGVSDGNDAGEGDVAWILLEWLEPGHPRGDAWERLGAGLAALHRTRAEQFGWHAHNYIGPLPQANDWSSDWPSFWRDRRLAPQLRIAREADALSREDQRSFDRLLDRLDDLLMPAAHDGASLLHGDLWNGNVHMLASGDAAIVDPSTYHGHREVDLAMAALFGGFSPAFFNAYRTSWPLTDGFDVRRAIYQLYYLLVHVNLFGAGYLSSTRSALARIPGV